MQRTEVISEKRPQRAVQVVPIEPSLRQRSCYLASGVIILLLFIINLSVAFNEVLLDRSFVSIWSIYSVFILVFSSIPFKPWKTLNQRRQQAARYNLTTRIILQAAASPHAEAPDLPDFFTIYTQYRWIRVYIIALISGLAVCLMSVIAYSYGQSMLQAVPHGILMAVAIWEISLNTACILAFIGLIFHLLIISPRQQIIATRDGLICRRGFHTSTIPWHRARLFAIVGQGRISKQDLMQFYELASSDSVIRWPSASRFVNQGIGNKVPAAVTFLSNFLARPVPSAAEFPQQVQFLNIIVAERTGLPLYDLR